MLTLGRILIIPSMFSGNCPNIWRSKKTWIKEAVLGRKYIALNSCFRKQERSKISDLRFHLRKLDNTEQLA